MSDSDRTTLLDLPLKYRRHAAPAAQDVAKPNGRETTT
jgi:hypothetical protein